MLCVVDIPLGVIGSSHSAPGYDVSSISEHGRSFLEMVLETEFSTAMVPVWN